MPRTDRWPERIGAVFLPQADTVEDRTPRAEGPPPLEQGCYTLSLRWDAADRYAPAYVGTLRVEQLGARVRFSGDLYRDQPAGDVLADPSGAPKESGPPSGEAADTGGTVPIYPRADYYSYLRGIGAGPSSTPPEGSDDAVVLEFEEFAYEQPAEGFKGWFRAEPPRGLRFVLVPTATPGLYNGTAHAGATRRGSVSIRWVSLSFRRIHVQLHALEGAVAPPAEVDGVTLATMFADAGWELSVADGGTIPLPAELAGIDIHDCWQPADMKTLLTSVPGFDPGELDSVWKTHLVAIPTKLGCNHGRMLEFLLFQDLSLCRLGVMTYSHDGYPSAEAPDGMGGSHYDAVTGLQQHQVPRAYLRSAAHEVGHAFGQIHQGVEGEADNSIMTPTSALATVLGPAGTFPDDIDLAFNERVKTHLRHLPDPAVRPGAMGISGSAATISQIPEAADVAWLEMLELSVEPSSDRVALGEPITLSWTLTNRGQAAVPAPAELAVESLVARVSVTDPTGRVIFLRPAEIDSCPRVSMVPLEPGASVGGSTTCSGVGRVRPPDARPARGRGDRAVGAGRRARRRLRRA